MNELTILNTLPATKREVNMLEVLEKTRETNMVTIDKQKVPDETSVAAVITFAGLFVHWLENGGY